MNKLNEKLIKSDEIYNGKIINLRVDYVELPNGKISTREVISYPGSVCILALTDNNEVALVKQYRCPVGKVILELPAGKLEKGEEPLKAAQRELFEETGVQGRDFVHLGDAYSNPGVADEVLHMYSCKVDSVGNLSLDEDEFLEPVFLDIDKAVDMVINGEIQDSKTQLCLLWIAKMRKYRH